MFWDKAAGLYDFFEDVSNGKVNRSLCQKVAEMVDPNDRVLECACGTGMISKHIGRTCKELIATDFSAGMLKQARKKCKDMPNVKIQIADIMKLEWNDNTFDKVVAGNVIHLLDNPYGALAELDRVCKAGGKIIIPTYINHENTGKPAILIKLIEKFGAGFKRQFSYAAYQEFFEKAGYPDAEYSFIEGKIPCAIAVITKK